jgi:hypothetical protein
VRSDKFLKGEHTNLYIILIGEIKMVKLGVLLLVLMVVLPFVSGIDLDIEKVDKGNVIVSEVGNPAKYDFVINNKGEAGNFEIYSLVGVSMSPRGTFELSGGRETKEVLVFPNDEILKQKGLYSFEYQIREQDGGIMKDTLLVKVVSLERILGVSGIINPDDFFFNLTLKNKENVELDSLKMRFKSEFFDFTNLISLKPNEERGIEVVIDREDTRDLVAGPYVVDVDIEGKKKKANIKGVILYLEKEGLASNELDEGIVIRKKTIEKTNLGNTPIVADASVRKDVFSRLFTSFSVLPDDIKREGLVVSYSWSGELGPNESFVVETKTNYTIPFLLVVFIVIIGLLVKMQSEGVVSVKKRSTLIKTKGGEFALKVSLRIKAKRHIDKIQIIDSLPGMMKIYEKFGRKPDRVDEKSRRIFWSMERLGKGEERVFSYIIYTKVKVLGRFEIPAATVVYESEGRAYQSRSNKTFFVTENFEKT